MNLCKCGCKKEVSKVGNRFIRGHNNRGIKFSEATKKKLSENKMGKNNPNYGKKLSEEHKKKLSEINKGRKLSEETKKKMSLSRKGINHYLYGKKRSEETKKKISESLIGEKNHNYGKKLSEETKKKLSECKCGENNPSWCDGKSFEPYCPKFNKELKDKIRNKYSRKCFNCGKDEKNNITKTGRPYKLSIHHVTYDKDEGCNDKEFTLIPLCVNCHIKTNYNREYWRKYFLDKLKGWK